MAVKFRKEAIKFLQKASPEEAIKIQSLLNQILICIEEQGIIPFTHPSYSRELPSAIVIRVVDRLKNPWNLDSIGIGDGFIPKPLRPRLYECFSYFPMVSQ